MKELRFVCRSSWDRIEKTSIQESQQGGKKKKLSKGSGLSQAQNNQLVAISAGFLQC